jgi:hypothetical protein
MGAGLRRKVAKEAATTRCAMAAWVLRRMVARERPRQVEATGAKSDRLAWARGSAWGCF